MTIGRAPGASLVLSDPSVSRVHARISRRRGARGRRLQPRDVAGRRAGDRSAAAARRREDPARRRGAARRAPPRRRPRPGARSSCGAGASLLVPSAGAARVAATHFGMRPRVRSGYALKRLDASEGRGAGCCATSHSGTFLRLSDNDAWLFQLLDGSHSLVELVAAVRAALRRDRAGAAGAAAVRPRRARVPRGRRRRRSRWPRRRRAAGASWSSRARRSSPGSAPRIESLYRHGGWVLFTRPVLIAPGGADRRRAGDVRLR